MQSNRSEVSIADYLHLIWPQVDIAPGVDAQTHDVTPGTAVMAFHQPASDVRRVSRFSWGMASAQTSRSIINARSEALAWEDSPWAPLLKTGRALVPVDGWFEYAALASDDEQGARPAYIARAELGATLLLAALTTWHPGAPDGAHSLVILTRDAPRDQRLTLNPRQPLALPPIVARAWLEPDTPPHLLFDILAVALPDTSFSRHPADDTGDEAPHALPHPRDAR